MKRPITAAWMGAGALVVALVLAGVAWAPRQSPEVAIAADVQSADGVRVSTSGRILPPLKGAYVGVFRPSGPFESKSLDTYRSITNRPAAMIMWFQSWTGNSAFNVAACEDVLERGAVPVITWEPWNPGVDANYVVNPANQPEYSLSKINSGAFDTYIRSWARGVKQVDGPVMIRPFHEMNGTWYPWGGTVNGNSSAAFRAAWKRVHGIFKAEGATNVTWVWSINHASVPDNYANRYAAYYPGDAYVDWTSISGFNWGTSRKNSQWRSFETLYSKPLTYLKTLGKPIILSEFASVSNGGDKAAWIRDSYARIKARPEIDAVIYYDKREVGLKGDQDWQSTTSWLTWRAYRRAIADPYFISGVPQPR